MLASSRDYNNSSTSGPLASGHAWPIQTRSAKPNPRPSEPEWAVLA
jgi:hypothetical protein